MRDEESFAEKLKAEYLDRKPTEFEVRKRDRERRLAIDCRVAAALGRPITEKEFLSANI